MPGLAPGGRWGPPGLAPAPYRTAARVFWVVENGSAQRGQTPVHRVAAACAPLRVVPPPVPASGRHPVASSGALGQRQVRTPKAFARLHEGEPRRRLSAALPNRQPRPCAWRLTRAKLAACLQRLEAHGVMLDQGDAAPEAPDAQQHTDPLAASPYQHL